LTGEQDDCGMTVALPLSYRELVPGGNRTHDPRVMKYPKSTPPAKVDVSGATYETAPGNKRQEFGTSALRYFVVRDYAPAPQSEHPGRALALLLVEAVEVTLTYRHRRN